jgi:YegS/Rv2252/BmrU family lipid kinase
MKALIILNPRSRGGGDSRVEAVVRTKFPPPETQLIKTEYPGHATVIARQAVRERVGMVIVVGGDGTVHEVLNGLVGSSVRLAIIPTGTANDLASYFGLPGDIEKACRVVQGGIAQPTDVIQVNDRFYITAGGVGFPSDVAGVASLIKRKSRFVRLIGRALAGKLYVVAAVWAILSRARHTIARVHSAGRDLTSDILSLTISNQPVLGGKFLISPGAVNDDGRADVCLIPNSQSALGVLGVIIKVLSGRHVNCPSVKTWRTDRLEIEAERPLAFLGDGELGGKTRKFSIRVHPRAVEVIAPAG